MPKYFNQNLVYISKYNKNRIKNYYELEILNGRRFQKILEMFKNVNDRTFIKGIEINPYAYLIVEYENFTPQGLEFNSIINDYHADILIVLVEKDDKLSIMNLPEFKKIFYKSIKQTNG